MAKTNKRKISVEEKKKTATPRAASASTARGYRANSSATMPKGNASTKRTDAYISSSGVRNAATGARISSGKKTATPRYTDTYISGTGARNAATGARVSTSGGRSLTRRRNGKRY